MTSLSAGNLRQISNREVKLPQPGSFELPEKVLQFGTGALLRGLPDYYIDQANRSGNFHGRVLAVKSTGRGPLEAFNRQDGLYTLCIKGIEKGKAVEENIVCSAISRVLQASSQWTDVLRAAANPELNIILSNTTEAGIKLVNERIDQIPPTSFPAKLLAFLYRRFENFGKQPDKDIVIIPAELIPDNGKVLENMIRELSALNGLETRFKDWLKEHVHFCNSLVDRIVPGRPADALVRSFEKEFQYSDELLIEAEPYNLWAIEGDDSIKSILSFCRGNEGIIITPNINVYRELKLRLLNATHILCSGLAQLTGIETVKKAMDHPSLNAYITDLMLTEISPAIPCPIDEKIKTDFVQKTIDRFRNPYINHLWSAISHDYSLKMKMRVLPVLFRYGELFHAAPGKIATGFAAYLLFMRAVRKEENQYFGKNNGSEYPIYDKQAPYFYNLWRQFPDDTNSLVSTVLKNEELWNADLTTLPGLSEKVTMRLEQIMRERAGYLKSI